MEAAVADVELEVRKKSYKVGILQEDIVWLSPQERQFRNAVIRRELAEQSRNKFLQLQQTIDPVSVLLEKEVKREGLLWIEIDPLSKKSARILAGTELLERRFKLIDQGQITHLLQTTTRYEDSRDLPEGVRALVKKIDHVRVRKERGEVCNSRFDNYTYPRLGISSLENSIAVAEDIARTAVNQADTIIDKGRALEFITPLGIGVLTFKDSEGLLFGGFVDSSVYTKQKTSQIKI